MTKYEELKAKEDECIKKALDTIDAYLKQFYLNASKGFQIKYGKLTIEQASEDVA